MPSSEVFAGFLCHANLDFKSSPSFVFPLSNCWPTVAGRGRCECREQRIQNIGLNQECNCFHLKEVQRQAGMAGFAGTQASCHMASMLMSPMIWGAVGMSATMAAGRRKGGRTDGRTSTAVGFLEGFFWEPHATLLHATHYRSQGPHSICKGGWEM